MSFIHEDQFIFSCTVPPSDNNLTRSGRWGKYPVEDYKDWLQVEAARLDDYLEGWTPDAEYWWDLRIYLWLKTGDGANRVKAAQDLLAGRRFDAKSKKIVDGPGLYANDKQVRGVNVWVKSIRSLEPRCVIEAVTVDAPTDERAEAEAAVRQAKQEARMEVVRTREAAKQQAREAAAAAAEAAAESLRRQVLWSLVSLDGRPQAEASLLDCARVLFPLTTGTAVKRALAELAAAGKVTKTAKGWVRV